MPFQLLLDGLVRAEDGVEAALMLDATGEVVVGAGASGDRPKLIGAYHGVALTALRRASERQGAGELEWLGWRYQEAAVLVRPLRDGYFLVVCLRDAAELPRFVHRTRAVQERMNEAL